jgi:hypothetical protein
MVELSIYRKVKRYENFPQDLDSAGCFTVLFASDELRLAVKLTYNRVTVEVILDKWPEFHFYV